jgi:hypothetical protein
MKIKSALICFGLLFSTTLAKAMPSIPFDGYLVLDGNDDIATTNVSASTLDEITIETFFLLETGSNSPFDKLQIVSTNDWTLYVIRYSIGGTRTGCIGYLGPGGWEHCKTSAIGLNAWHHLALTVKNGQGQFYLNGETFGNPHSIPIPMLNGTLNVGNNFNGYLDELRISDIARYNANFAIPSQKFICDNNTLNLWGFDEPEGSTAFSDRCGESSLLGQNGAHSEGGLTLAFEVYLPQIIK